MLNKRIINLRWEAAKAAKKEAKRINNLFRKGYIASYETRIIYNKLSITKNGIYENIGKNCKIIWFERNNSCLGLYDPIKVIRSTFRGIRFVKKLK